MFAAGASLESRWDKELDDSQLFCKQAGGRYQTYRVFRLSLIFEGYGGGAAYSSDSHNRVTSPRFSDIALRSCKRPSTINRLIGVPLTGH